MRNALFLALSSEKCCVQIKLDGCLEPSNTLGPTHRTKNPSDRPESVSQVVFSLCFFLWLTILPYNIYMHGYYYISTWSIWKLFWVHAGGTRLVIYGKTCWMRILLLQSPTMNTSSKDPKFPPSISVRNPTNSTN